jgi:hypothetical protein
MISDFIALIRLLINAAIFKPARGCLKINSQEMKRILSGILEWLLIN